MRRRPLTTRLVLPCLLAVVVAVSASATAVRTTPAPATSAGAATPPAAEPSAPVTVRAWTEPEDGLTIGQRFRYLIEVTSEPGIEIVVTQPTERLGDFEIVDFGTLPAAQRDGRTVVTRWYRLVGWSTGHHLVTSPVVRYRKPGEELQEAPRDDIGVELVSLVGDAGDDADLHDIKSPEPFPIDWRPWYLLGGVLLALAALAAGVRFLLARRRRAALPPPPRPAGEVAAAALAALRLRRLPQQGAWKEYYSELSAIMRTYLEQRFGLRAPEMTTEEFLVATARGGRLDRAHRGLLADFLAESDLVKFARHVPTVADSDRAFAAAGRVVAETTEVVPLTSEQRGEQSRAAG